MPAQSDTARYDTIGVDYARLRRPDPRIAAQIEAALGDARTVLNVGAGTGSYEPTARSVTAVEPSATMIAQRPLGAAPAVQAFAEELPFADDSFDAAMAVLTLHHWSDQRRGLAEMRRVARGAVVLLTFDPAHPGAWLADYLPELRALDAALMPTIAELGEWLGAIEVSPVPVPADCVDGFIYAWWARPRAYLDRRVRAGSSSFWTIGGAEAGLTRLAEDLDSGSWQERYGHLLALDAIDCGYRLVVAR